MIGTRKTTNYELIERMDLKVFGKAECGYVLPTSSWFLGLIDDKIAAYAGLTPFLENGHKYGYLERVGVTEKYRGQGLQRLLIQAREAEARRLEIEAVCTYTAAWNHASSNNLIRCGYTLYHPFRKYGVKDALYWSKKL